MNQKFRKNGFYENQAECLGNPLQRQDAKTNAVGLGESETGIEKKNEREMDRNLEFYIQKRF